MNTFRKVQDFLTIIRGTWFMLLLNLVAVYAFLFQQPDGMCSWSLLKIPVAEKTFAVSNIQSRPLVLDVCFGFRDFGFNKADR